MATIVKVIDKWLKFGKYSRQRKIKCHCRPSFCFSLFGQVIHTWGWRILLITQKEALAAQINTRHGRNTCITKFSSIKFRGRSSSIQGPERERERETDCGILEVQLGKLYVLVVVLCFTWKPWIIMNMTGLGYRGRGRHEEALNQKSGSNQALMTCGHEQAAI